MNLWKLCENLSYVMIKGEESTEVTGISYHSQNVKTGDAFVCIQGLHRDGHDYIKEAVLKGAKAIFIERMVSLDDIPDGVSVVRIHSSLEALARLSATFFDYPQKGMILIGVTGTKGKTTTTYMLREILKKAGHKVGLIGTIGCYLGEESVPLLHTTPPSFEIFRLLREMKKRGCTHVVMEVSSQGIMKHRVDGIMFQYAIFTNLSMDHIGPGEHENFEEYLFWKKQLFSHCEIAVINQDDPYGKNMENGCTCPVITYGALQNKDSSEHFISGFYQERREHFQSDFTFSNEMKLKSNDFLGTVFDVQYPQGSITCSLGLAGDFNIYNALAAMAVGFHMGISFEVMKAALSELRIKGRVEVIFSNDRYFLLIDYAHNAISLQSLLMTLREYQPTRLVCIFGCGGNRSSKRRAAMGTVSGNYADLTIVTEDNSREESRMKIIMDILQGLSQTRGEYLVIPDRKDAIRYSMKFSQPGDFIVLAGKGHENYMEIGGHRVPFDEREIVRGFL